MRIRCYSMAEESLMSESGNEMEANAWDKQQGGEAEMSGQETGQNATESRQESFGTLNRIIVIPRNYQRILVGIPQ